MNILRELFFGNICPFEQIHPAGEAYRKTVDESIRISTAFREKLDETQGKLYEESTKLWTQISMEQSIDAFERGFRLAMRLILTTIEKEPNDPKGSSPKSIVSESLF